VTEVQSPFDKILKQHDFIYILKRKRMAKRWPSLNNILPLKKTLSNEILEVVSGTLIVSSVAERRMGSLLLLLLVPLAGGLLVSHLDVMNAFPYFRSGAQEKGAECGQGEWEGREDGNSVNLDLGAVAARR
jgi:hypothetical protein